MRVEVLLEKETGWLWIHVPERHIKFRHARSGQSGLIIIAFRTDGFRRVQSGLMPMEQWLRESHETRGQVEVPEEIVLFALRSEAQRQNWVDHFTSSLIEKGFPKQAYSITEDFHRSITDADGEYPEESEEKEYRFAQVVQTLLQNL